MKYWQALNVHYDCGYIASLQSSDNHGVCSILTRSLCFLDRIQIKPQYSSTPVYLHPNTHNACHNSAHKHWRHGEHLEMGKPYHDYF